MFLEEKSQSVIELALHQLIPLSIASATLLTVLGTFLVAQVLQPFISDFERTYYRDTLCGKGSNESVISFVNVQERIKIIIEDSSASIAGHGVSGFKFCRHVQYRYICQRALTELAIVTFNTDLKTS